MATRKINFTAAAGLIAGGATTRQVADKFGVKPESLRIGLLRHGVSVSDIREDDMRIEMAERALVSVIERQSGEVRAALSRTLAATTSNLSEIKPGRSLKKLAAVVQVAEGAARTAKHVYGWGEGDKPGLLAINHLHLEVTDPALPPPASEEQPVEVEAVPEPALLDVEAQVSAGEPDAQAAAPHP